MKTHFFIEESDIQAVQSLVEKMKDHPFVQSRIARNIQGEVSQASQSLMWQTLIMCLLSTQNKSGKGSRLDIFSNQIPFALALSTCRDDANPDFLIPNVLSNLGIRRWKVSADFALKNLQVLEQGGWKKLEIWSQRLMQQRNGSIILDDFSLEREAARDVQSFLKGMGPKQSRNFWQELRLFRYEIPIDSRILKWCYANLDFYIPVPGIADERYYGQVMDAIRELCKKSGLVPCVLDAAIFVSFEKPRL